MINSFLKNKSKYIDNLLNSLDVQLVNVDTSIAMGIKKSLLQIFTRCARKEPSARIEINIISESLEQIK